VTFAQPIGIPVTEKPTGVAIARLLSATNPTIAVVRGGSPGVTLLTFGAGGWGIDRTLPIAQTAARDIAVGRLDGDALDDLVVATNEGFSIVLSSNVPLLADRIDYQGPTGQTAIGGDGIAVGDLDEDGIADVAVGGTTLDQVVWWKHSPMTSSWLQQAGVVAMNDPVGLAIANFDGSKGNDIGVVLNGNDKIRVLFDFGATFAGVDVGTGMRPTAAAAGDIDGDGKPDLVVTLAGSNQVAILWGEDAMSFLTPTLLNVGQEPVDVALGDLDGDGALDIVTANKAGNSMSIAVHAAPRTRGVTSIALSRELGGIAVGDLDVVVTFPNENAVAVLMNQRL
jgi:hypothetical protein